MTVRELMHKLVDCHPDTSVAIQTRNGVYTLHVDAEVLMLDTDNERACFESHRHYPSRYDANCMTFKISED